MVTKILGGNSRGILRRNIYMEGGLMVIQDIWDKGGYEGEEATV